MLWFVLGMVMGLAVAAICVGQMEKEEKEAEEKKNRQRGNADGSKGGSI